MPLAGLDSFVTELGQDLVERASNALMNDLIDAAPVDTGELRDSAFGPDIDTTGLAARVGFDAPQADYTNLGTRPHEIVAVNAPVLYFFWERGPSGAGWYAFPRVHHPGQEGTHWFDDKVDEWDEYLQDASES